MTNQVNNSDKPINLGIVGLGYIATHTHIPLWLKNKSVHIAAVCDADEAKTCAASERFHIPRKYYSIDDMLSNERFDLIDICTPPESHEALALKVLDSGTNCMLEKPMTTSVLAADRMINRAKEKKLHIFVTHHSSFFPILQQGKNLVHSGEIGDLLQVDVKYACPLEKAHQNPNHWAHKLPGGLFGEQAPHACYALVDFLDDDIMDVKSFLMKKSSYSYLAGDELKVIVSTKSMIGSFSVSFISPQRITVDLMGSKAWVSIDAESQALVKYPHIEMGVFSKGKRSFSDISQRGYCLCRASFNVVTGRWKPLLIGHEYLFNKAIMTLRNQATYPVSVEKARNSVRILEAAFRQNGLFIEH
jgi:predicted dehydrogenase